MTAGGTGQLTLALGSADLSAEVGRTVTFTSSDTSTATVAPGTTTIQVATHSYPITVTGVSAGSATITATCTDGQGVTWTSTATTTVADATQVIVAEQSLQDIADAIRGKLGVATTYKPADMASAIESISGGGGGVDISAFRGCTKIEVGVYQPTSMNPNTIPHSLGLVPKLFALYETTLSMGGRNSLIQDLIAQTSTYLSGDIIGGLCYNMMDMLNMVAVPSGMVSFSSTGVTISSTTYKMDTTVSYMYIVIG